MSDQPLPKADPNPPLPTPDDLRWARLAKELPFDELAAVRRQAESWRNALVTTTALLGTVTLVRGREDFSPLEAPWRYAVTALLGLGLTALVAASLLAAVAAFGRPGSAISAGGRSLQVWSQAQARNAVRLILTAAVLSVLGIALIMVATGITWLAPVVAG